VNWTNDYSSKEGEHCQDEQYRENQPSRIGSLPVQHIPLLVTDRYSSGWRNSPICLRTSATLVEVIHAALIP
jgi:hypothetical protein